MSEIETILKQDSGVKAYEGEHPPTMGLKAGAFADVGTLILTNQRLVYINKGGGARSATYVLGGALAARVVEKNVSKADLDDQMKYKGSYSISIQDITHVESGRHMGAGFLRVDNRSSGLKPSYSYIFEGGKSNDEWATAINSAIISLHLTLPSASPINQPPINQPTNPQPINGTVNQPNQITCPSCGKIVNSASKFCTSCGAPIPTPKPSTPIVTPKFCGSCGTKLNPGALFCEECGAKVTE